MDRGDYEPAYSKAVAALRDCSPDAAPLTPDLLEVAGYCCEYFRQQHLEEFDMQIPTDADLDWLTDLAMQEKADLISAASVLSTFGRIYYDRENYPQAESAMSKALRSIEPMAFSGKSSFLPDYEYLVYALCWQSKFAEAEHTAQKWLAFAEAELFANDIYTAKIHKSLADIYRARDLPLLAEDHLKRCLWLHENEQCMVCADVVGALRAYADLLDGQGRSEESAEMRQRADEIETETEAETDDV